MSSYNWDRAPTVWERHGRRIMCLIAAALCIAAGAYIAT